MRLRTRLALAFAVLSVVPLTLVVPVALRDLRRTLSTELDTHVQVATNAAGTVMDRTRADVRRAVEELAESVALEEVAKEIHQGGGSRTATAGERLMKSRGLTVLSLFDKKGITLSSGHLPARLGDPDDALFAVTRRTDKATTSVLVEVRDEKGLRKVPALVTAREMDYGDVKVWVVGGVLLDAQLASHLANLTGARVEIRQKDEVIAAVGTAEPPVVDRAEELEPSASIHFQYSRASLIQAESGVLRAFGTLVAIGLALSVLLGIFIARRITRPVEALTTAARKIGAGALDFQVEEKATGEVGELVGAFNRMTSELKRTTQQLVATERVAAWQEVAKRLAHEIKNPLTPIKMSLETLLAAQRSNNPRFASLFQESAGAVLEEVERLRRIVDEFSQFARLPKPQLRRMDITELTSQVLTIYASPPEGITLAHELTPNLTADADRDQLTQVLVNLIKNAEEAMTSGGRVTVRTRVDDEEGDTVIEVQDQGPGIKAEDRARIFEPYFTTKTGGTGLGLAIAARVIQEHGGRLELTSEPGQGALFRVRLPAIKK